jgi:hypothetical protein
MYPSPALVAAIALSRAPSLAGVLRTQALPDGVQLLLSILARDPDAAQKARAMTGLREAELIAAVELYVLQVMLYPGAPSRRILGVPPNADRAVIRAHLRLLLTWLHPDKNSSAWHAPFARRVIAAWRQIDSGLEDEQPRGWLAHRVPWIASPLEATRQRSRWRASKGLRVFLAGVALIRGRHGAR